MQSEGQNMTLNNGNQTMTLRTTKIVNQFAFNCLYKLVVLACFSVSSFFSSDHFWQTRKLQHRQVTPGKKEIMNARLSFLLW